MADSFLPPAVLDMIVNAAEWTAGLDKATEPLEAINDLMAETGTAAGDMSAAIGTAADGMASAVSGAADAVAGSQEAIGASSEAMAGTVTASMGEVEAAISAAAEASELSSEPLAAYSEGLIAAAGSAGDLTLAQAELKASSAEVRAAVADLGAVQLTAGKDSDEYAAQLNVVADAMLREQDAAYQLRNAQLAAADATSAAAGEADAAAGQVAALGGAETEMGAKASAAGDEAEAAGGKASKGFKLWALAAVAGVAISVKMAGDFQQSMTRLVTSAGETQGNLGMVSQGILGMSVATNTSTSQLAQGMYMVESAGYHGAAGLTVLKAAAEGAQAEGADLYDVANAVTSGLNAYGLSAQHATSFTNQMLTTVGQGKMTMQDLASSLSAVLPIAASYKISFAQVGGALATMTSMGMSARQGTQDLAATIRSLGNPTSVATNEMSQFGILSTKVSQMLGKQGLTGTIGYLSDAITSKMGKSGLVLVNSMNQSKAAAQDAQIMLAQLPKPIQAVSKAYLDGGASYTTWYNATKSLPLTAKTMADQFASVAGKAHGFNNLLASGSPAAQTYSAAMAKMLGGATGLNVGLMLTGTHAKTFNDNVKAISGSAKGAGSNVKGWALIQSNFNFQLGAAEKSAQAVAISFGTVLLPAAKKVMGVIAEFGGWLVKHSAACKAFAIVVGVLLAGALEHGLAKALKSCVSGLQDMAKPLMKLVGLSGEQAGAAAAQAAATDASTAATEAGTVATEGATGATAALGAVMDALPIIAIIAAVIALAIGFYELYKHCQLVREIVADVGHFFVMLWHDAGGLKGALIDLGIAFGVALTGGIGLAVVAFIELYKHCALVRDIVADVAHFLMSTWDTAFSDVSRAVQAFAHDTLGWAEQQLALFSKFWAQHGDEVKEIAHAVWAAVTAVFRVAMTVITAVAKTGLGVLEAVFRFTFGSLADIASGAWAVITALTRAAWSVIGPIVRFGLALITGALRAAMAVITAVFRAAWDACVIVARTAWSVLGQVIHLGLELILGIVGVVLDLVTGHWSKAWHDLTGLASTALHGTVGIIMTIASGFGNLLYSAGKAIVEGLIHGVEDMGGAAVGAVENLGSSMLHGAMSFLGISSPSKEFAALGEQITAGLALGINSSSQQAIDESRFLAEQVTDAFAAGAITKTEAADLRKSLSEALSTALKGGVQDALATGTTHQIGAATIKLLKAVWDTAAGGFIDHSAASKLAEWVKADNARLQALAVKRNAVAKEIAAAQSLASSTASAAESSYSLSSAATTSAGGTASVSSIISTLKGDVAQIRKFSADLRKLARMGLNKAYLQQLIAMGPSAGGALAAELASSGLGDIKQINAAEAAVTKASNALGDAAVSAMYTAGEQSGAGFLAGLKAQEKAIEAVMAQIAASMVKKLRQELGIASPSKVMFTHGQMIAQGLALGIASGVGQVSRAVRGLAAATSLAGTRSTIPAGVLSSAGGGAAIELHLDLTMVGEMDKQKVMTGTKQATYRYNVRNSGSVTGVMKPGS